jgi:alcohol dehydrogenase class IV
VGAGSDAGEAAKHATDFVEDFYRKLGMPVRLRDADIPQDGIERIAHDAMGDFYLHQNARKVKDPSELSALLKQMW